MFNRTTPEPMIGYVVIVAKKFSRSDDLNLAEFYAAGKMSRVMAQRFLVGLTSFNLHLTRDLWINYHAVVVQL